MTSLDEWIEDEAGVEDATSQANTTKPDTTPSERRIDQTQIDSGADYDKDVKCCPHCLSPGPRAEKAGEDREGKSRRHWNCTNDKCGVQRFTMSYFEFVRRGWAKESEFLFSIDWVEAMKEIEERLGKTDGI